MKYRDLKPKELVEEGDEVDFGYGWMPSLAWDEPDRTQCKNMRYRRPIKDTIQDRLQALAVEMNSVSMWMQCDDNSELMKYRGRVLREGQLEVSRWLDSMAAEETIQGFVEGRKK